MLWRQHALANREVFARDDFRLRKLIEVAQGDREVVARLER